MNLIVDVLGNRISIDGTWHAGQRRWEAAALACLITSTNGTGPDTVPRETLAKVLLALGQDTELDRTGWRRLWTSVASLFEAAGKLEGFNKRFGYQRRTLTVGPWWWRGMASDSIEVRGSGTKHSHPPIVELPAVAADRSLKSTLVLARKLAIVHSLWLYGSRQSAIEELTAGPEWELAAPPVLTHRALTLADAYAMTEQYALARQQLRVAFRLIDRHMTCRDQRTFAEFLRISIADSGKRGLAPNRNAAQATLQLLADRTRSGNEVDARTRAWVYMRAAYGLRGDLEGSSGSPKDESDVKQHVVDLLSAAICMAIVDWHADLVPIAIEAFLRDLAPIALSDGRTGLSECIDCYIAAQHWRNMLDMANSFEVGREFLGLLIAEHPEASGVIDERVAAGLWIGPRADTPAFFQESLTRSLNTGDPKSIARAALASYRFSKRLRAQRSARTQAETLFLRTVREHPTLAAMLAALGMLKSVPELAAKI